MSKPTYDGIRGLAERELVWLGSGIKTPPFSLAGRIEAGHRLRLLQRGERIGMPHSRPMPSIGPRCHELRVRDADHSWRLVYRIDPDAIVIVEVFAKSSGRTPLEIVGLCRRRLRAYDEAATGGHQG
jgi:phage-related protein